MEYNDGWPFRIIKNSKCSSFNSKYLRPSTEVVNAFSQDWSNEINSKVTTIYFILKCLTHFFLRKSGTTGILMLSCWLSATFWPLLFEKQKIYKYYSGCIILVEHSVRIGRLWGIFHRGKTFTIPFITYFINLIEEHLIARIGVHDSYLKKWLRDHAPSVMQDVRRANTLKFYNKSISVNVKDGPKDLKKQNHHQQRVSI